MMIGTYPCCEAPLVIELPDVELPKLMPENCPQCGAKIWHMFSRVKPQTWTEEDFLKEYEVNQEKMTIKKRKD